MTEVTPRDVATLLELFERGDWREMRLSGGGVELLVSKDPAARLASNRPTTATAAARGTGGPTHGARSAGGAARAAAPDPVGLGAVRAPCLGTFYRAPKPGAAPYVEVGQRVTADTEVCIVEVMKLFTAVRAGVAGVVREVPVKDAELVELGQALMWIEPDA